MTVLAKDPTRYVETAIDEEIVVMLLESGDFFSLRDSARTIWDLIDGGRDREAILSELASGYDAPPPTISTVSSPSYAAPGCSPADADDARRRALARTRRDP
jgi:hypothetical protein